ncbi:GTP pyrophosphokinase family protein [Bifidobacterium sp. SMA15]|uniref:GTP pyrophosphokinase family protein n=1 Tax=Bifidobacterium platyrrhinorum TaxID=2661628 RepID=A0A6L9SPJ0_9BIFI|nr:GTP pyrophosphokinase family protein [Bifidobacterium platyrrhinorum]
MSRHGKRPRAGVPPERAGAGLDASWGEFVRRTPGDAREPESPAGILECVILDRHSRLSSADLKARLKGLNLSDSIFTADQITEFVDLMQVYEGAMYEISTKLEILDNEFQVRFAHDPIHHMERRLKSVNSIIGKLERKGLPIAVESIKDNLFDVAGIRVICNYRDDVYSVSNYLSAQSDIQVLRVKDYIKRPKQNGYRSLHVIYAVPVFLSSGAHYTPVEVQFRTIAMDYWASLEHALRYKTDLPDARLNEHSQTLLDCARSLQNIEVQMQNIHRDINGAPVVEQTPKTTD